MEQTLQDYGYWVVLIGAFFEGEAVLLMGVLAAASGYLALPWVIFSAFLGSFLGDQLYFYLGRCHGPALLAKRPEWEAKVARMRRLLHRYHLPLILSVRFMYGIRAAALIAIGLSPLAAPRFIVLNAIGAAVWALLIGITGFLLGDTLTALLGTMQHIQLEVFGGILFGTVALWTLRCVHRRFASSGGR